MKKDERVAHVASYFVKSLAMQQGPRLHQTKASKYLSVQEAAHDIAA
jgi:hypothetical protein